MRSPHCGQRGGTSLQCDLSIRVLDADEGSSGTLAAGDRASDALLVRREGRPGRLFTLYAGPDWTLLRLGSAAPRLHHPGVRSHDIGTDILNVRGEDHRNRQQFLPARTRSQRPPGKLRLSVREHFAE